MVPIVHDIHNHTMKFCLSENDVNTNVLPIYSCTLLMFDDVDGWWCEGWCEWRGGGVRVVGVEGSWDWRGGGV